MSGGSPSRPGARCSRRPQAPRWTPGRPLAVEHRTGTAAVGPASAALACGTVRSEGGRRALTAWPWRNWGANLPQLMASVVAGEGCETARFSRCRLVAVEWPPDLVAALGGGPRFGIDGVRRLLGPGAHGRPLLGGIIKPSLGLTPEEVAATAAALVLGGCDFVKDDELMADPEWCPFSARGPAVAQVLAATGRPCLYAAHVSGPVGTLPDPAAAAVVARAGG